MQKEGKSRGYGRADGGSDGAERVSETESRLHPKTTPARAISPFVPYPPIVSQPPPSSRSSFVAPRTPGQGFSTQPGDEPTYRVLRPPIDGVCCTPASDSPSNRSPKGNRIETTCFQHLAKYRPSDPSRPILLNRRSLNSQINSKSDIFPNDELFLF